MTLDALERLAPNLRQTIRDKWRSGSKWQAKDSNWVLLLFVASQKYVRRFLFTRC
jgi:hypothetical protein